jgi:hypothetical protein
VDEWQAIAGEILSRHGESGEGLRYLGAGEQSVCYGTRRRAILLSRAPDCPAANAYAVQRWLTARAVSGGVHTPPILAVGARPRRYALMERAHGVKAGINAGTPGEVADWFRLMGREVRKVNRIPTEGFGAFVPCAHGGYRGEHATWGEYVDAQMARYLFRGTLHPEQRRVREILLDQGIIGWAELEKVAAQLQTARDWPVQSVLVHYDNRLDNLLVDGERVTLLDWGLAVAGVGIEQELIKLFEVASTSTDDPLLAAFLDGYGLPGAAWETAIAGGKLMLVLDGLAMSYSWVDEPGRMKGIRAWLRTIKGICDGW